MIIGPNQRCINRYKIHENDIDKVKKDLIKCLVQKLIKNENNVTTIAGYFKVFFWYVSSTDCLDKASTNILSPLNCSLVLNSTCYIDRF